MHFDGTANDKFDDWIALQDDHAIHNCKQRARSCSPGLAAALGGRRR
jgi:hypothetical protein